MGRMCKVSTGRASYRLLAHRMEAYVKRKLIHALTLEGLLDVYHSSLQTESAEVHADFAYIYAGAPIFSEKSSSLCRRHYVALCLPILLRSAPGTTNTLLKL